MLFYCVFSVKDVILFFDYVYRNAEFVHMSTNGPGAQKRSLDSPEVIGHCELHGVSSGNQIQVLNMSIISS